MEWKSSEFLFYYLTCIAPLVEGEPCLRWSESSKSVLSLIAGLKQSTWQTIFWPTRNKTMYLRVVLPFFYHVCGQISSVDLLSDVTSQMIWNWPDIKCYCRLPLSKSRLIPLKYSPLVTKPQRKKTKNYLNFKDTGTEPKARTL